MQTTIDTRRSIAERIAEADQRCRMCLGAGMLQNDRLVSCWNCGGTGRENKAMPQATLDAIDYWIVRPDEPEDFAANYPAAAKVDPS